MSTKIQWTDETWNPVTGCDRVSPGCDHCYAERIATRFGRDFLGTVVLRHDRLDDPLRWRKPRRVFVNSVSDLFHLDIPDDFIAKVWARMGLAEQHSFQVLTKRPQRMERLLSSGEFRRAWWSYRNGRAVERDVQLAAQRGDVSLACRWPLPNVWLGVSVENQRYADLRIPHLLRTPAAVRFVSAEPLLGPVVFRSEWLDGGWDPKWCGDPDHCSGKLFDDSLDWVIIGGESGPHARPMAPAWAQSIVGQCRQEVVSVFVKQMGTGSPLYNQRTHHDITKFPPALKVREWPAEIGASM